jgi:DNA invertase Pin-like site-specific DNA recombinase
MMRERTMAGQKRARAQGVKIGRPSKLNSAVRTSAKLLRDGGVGIKEISKLSVLIPYGRSRRYLSI